ncbi:MAG: TRAP transporter small permease subunit [Gammaproteobacteria bacterium]
MIKKIDLLSETAGKLTAWLILFMVILISYDVTMRYLFQSGSVALQELEWHLFSIVFLLGAAYALKHDEHVRVDLIYKSKRLNDRHRAMINIFGGLFFLIPFCLLIILNSWSFIENSFSLNETSPDPGGLPYRWLLKAMINIGFTLLLLQGLAETLRNISFLMKDKS